MFCPKCGRKLVEGDSFCSNCGQVVPFNTRNMVNLDRPISPEPEKARIAYPPTYSQRKKARGRKIAALIVLIIVALFAAMAAIRMNAEPLELSYDLAYDSLSGRYEYALESVSMSNGGVIKYSVLLDQWLSSMDVFLFNETGLAKWANGTGPIDPVAKTTVLGIVGVKMTEIHLPPGDYWFVLNPQTYPETGTFEYSVVYD